MLIVVCCSLRVGCYDLSLRVVRCCGVCLSLRVVRCVLLMCRYYLCVVRVHGLLSVVCYAMCVVY